MPLLLPLLLLLPFLLPAGPLNRWLMSLVLLLLLQLLQLQLPGAARSMRLPCRIRSGAPFEAVLCVHEGVDGPQ